MAEPLKNFYGADIPLKVAAMIEPVYPGFDTETFVGECLVGYEDLELTPRARQISQCLGSHLPAAFGDAARILTASLGPPIAGDELIGQGMRSFVYLPYVYYVAEHGAGHWAAAMSFQHELTQRMSCEYSIRVFIESDEERTMARLREWAADDNPHVRRLVSEGTRPRLPWAPRLRRFVADPRPVVELLDLLKDDPSSMVRRSVANNLNDIGKDHPGVLTEVCRRWMDGGTPEREAMIRHALRGAVKRGDREALDILGYGSASDVAVANMAVEPDVVAIGGQVRVSFTLINASPTSGKYNVDLKVHFVKATGSTSSKVFKVRSVTLTPEENVKLSKIISVAQHTTRTHHPGIHQLEVVVNGAVVAADSFRITG